MSLKSSSEIRRALRDSLPAQAFEPQPIRGIAAMLGFGLVVALAVAIIYFDFPWYVDGVLSLALGQGIASVGLAAHESEHGGMFRSKLARKALAWMGFGPLLVTPGLWSAWHMQAHHRGTNQVDWDPDMLADHQQYRERWAFRIRALLFPGSRHVLSVIGYFVLFTLEGQYFLWLLSNKPPFAGRLRIDHNALRLSSVLLIGSWLAGAFAVGWVNAIWVFFLPLAIANLVLMAYISTQHWIRPRVHADDPVVTTISVTVPRFMDWLHFGFSYHQEHHLFPSMSARFAPLVRAKLAEIEPDALAVLSFWEVTKILFSTPVLYADDATLITADAKARVELQDIATSLNLPMRDAT